MNFCPECGAPVQPAGKFCVGCGQNLSRWSVVPERAPIRVSKLFVTLFVVIVIAGLGVVGLLAHQQETIQASREAAAPTNLPPGHPKIELPKVARDFINGVQADAKAKPNDIAAWDKLGAVSLRAAQFDPSYYQLATQAFAHVLKLDPNDPPALRGIGDIDYDRQQYDEAIAAYEHYLKIAPNDPQVLVDLGTMNLYTGNADQALHLYHQAVTIKPNFFEGYYNMAVAYAAQNDNDHARAAFAQALKQAPDADARKRVNDMLAKLNGAPSSPPPMESAAADSAPPPSAAAAVAPATTFKGQIEALVRNLPVAGPKVSSVQWPAANKAVVLMDNFPMDAMPPFIKQRFVSDLSTGIDQAKQTYHVATPFQLDIADAASGRVMQTISR